MRLKQVIYFLFLTLFFFTACKKVDIEYGNQVLENQYTQAVSVDTFTTSLATLFVDSFPTSGTGVTLLGGFTDTAFGRLDTKCYFDLNPPAYEKVYDSTRFDSLRLILKLNRNYYGDTTQPIHIDVKRLSQQILFPQNVYSFYNVDKFPVYSDLIGSGDFLVHPTYYTDSISVKLSDALGKTLLNKLKNPLDLDLQNSENFLHYFNGICLSGNSKNNLILNCTDAIVMRLTYSKPGPDTLEKHYIDFTLANKEHHFNNIQVDRSNTPLKNIGHKDSVFSSSRLNNRAYSQYASGVLTKITFPTLYNLLKVPYYSKILSAQLKIVPVKGTYDTYHFLPPSLNLTPTNLSNIVGGGLTIPGTNSVQNGNLVIDYTTGDNTSYNYDVSNYIKALIANPLAYGYSINNTPANNYGLLLVPPSPASITQFSRIILGDQNQPKNFRTILQINYLTVQP